MQLGMLHLLLCLDIGLVDKRLAMPGGQRTHDASARVVWARRVQEQAVTRLVCKWRSCRPDEGRGWFEVRYYPWGRTYGAYAYRLSSIPYGGEMSRTPVDGGASNILPYHSHERFDSLEPSRLT